MSFRLLSIGTMYQGSLDLFYKENAEALTYEEQNRMLLSTTTEFIGSYWKNFIKNGIKADAIVINDNYLQSKWVTEHLKSQDNSMQTLLGQVRFYNPEVLFIENLGIVNDEFINNARREIKSLKLVLGYHCAPLNQNVEKSIRACDLILTCTPGLRDYFISNGKKTHLVYHAFDEDILNALDPKIDEKQQIDIVFSGSMTTGGNFHNERIRLIEAILEEGIEIRLFVNLESNIRIRAKQVLYLINNSLNKAGLTGLSEKIKILDYGRTKVENYSTTLLSTCLPPVFGTDMLNLFRKSKIVLNYHIGIAGDYAGNMRMFEVTGAGSCLLTDNKKNMSDLFTNGKDVVLYDNKEDCIQKIKWLLEHDKERRAIAESGHKKTLLEHTVYNRCEIIKRIITAELNG